MKKLRKKQDAGRRQKGGVPSSGSKPPDIQRSISEGQSQSHPVHLAMYKKDLFGFKKEKSSQSIGNDLDVPRTIVKKLSQSKKDVGAKVVSSNPLFGKEPGNASISAKTGHRKDSSVKPKTKTKSSSSIIKGPQSQNAPPPPPPTLDKEIETLNKMENTSGLGETPTSSSSAGTKTGAENSDFGIKEIKKRNPPTSPRSEMKIEKAQAGPAKARIQKVDFGTTQRETAAPKLLQNNKPRKDTFVPLTKSKNIQRKKEDYQQFSDSQLSVKDLLKLRAQRR